jgi:hypothetical protein
MFCRLSRAGWPRRIYDASDEGNDAVVITALHDKRASRSKMFTCRIDRYIVHDGDGVEVLNKQESSAPPLISDPLPKFRPVWET